MKAIVLHGVGGPSQLWLEEVPIPEPGPREVLVKVRACGVCYHDVVVMRGIMRRGVKIPVILGNELAGEVVKLGEGVRNLAPGDRVASYMARGIGHGRDGAYAEYVALPEDILFKVPPEVSLEEAAIFRCPIAVAFRGLTRVAQVRAGEDILITGAGGGLGVHSIQIARLCGARVICVTSSQDKVEKLKELGAHEVVYSPNLDFSEGVKQVTGGRGVDIVIENVGGLLFQQSFRCLAERGRMVFLGEVQGVEFKLNPALLFFKNVSLHGSGGGSREDVETVTKLVRLGWLKPIIQTFPLEEAPRVHQMMLDRKTFGRAVLLVD